MATILVIDDDLDLQQMLRLMLQRGGYKVLTTGDGPDGLAKAKMIKPDMAIVDVMMPGMNGLETCRLLRAEPTIRDTPIILLTASDDPDLGAKGREVGATATIRKPFGSSNIIGAVEQALGRKIGPLPR